MDKIAEQFRTPPKDYSPAPIWWWSGDRLELDRLRWQMDLFKEGGVYNLVVLNLAPTGPMYGSDADRPRFLSEEWWDIFDGVCAYADEIGMRIWFYDQIGFSGANLQGELVRENAGYAGQHLECLVTEGTGLLEAHCPSGGTPLTATAAAIDEDGRTTGPFESVPVEDRRASIECSTPHRLRLIYTVQRNFDYFSAEACDRLLGMVHKEFERRLGKWFGRVIVGSFQDELPNVPAWSAEFAEAFAARKGYDLLEYASYLWEGEHSEAQQVRMDYQEVRAELAEEAFFIPFYEWHVRNGLICGFDQQGPAREGDAPGGVRSYADYLRTHRWYGAPGSDHHGETKIHSSLAHLNGRERVWIEVFHSSGWGGTLEETYDWLIPWIRAGGNLYNPHAAYYSTRGGWYEWAPPSTCWRQPYWRHYSRFADAVSRLCYLLTRGSHVCDIGVLFPTATVQAHHTLQGPLEPTLLARDCYRALVGKMYWNMPKTGVLDGDGRDFDVLSDEAVTEAVVRDGRLLIRDESYRAVVLPACSVVRERTAEILVRFAENGGLLIAVGTIPGPPSTGGEWTVKLKGLFDRGQARFIASAEALPDALSGLPKEIEAAVPTLHRRVDDYDLLFVPSLFPMATEHGPFTVWQHPDYSFSPDRYVRETSITVREKVRDAELWDPLSGERRPAAVSQDAEGRSVITVPFDQGPASVLVWKRTDERSKPLRSEEKPADSSPLHQGVLAEISGRWKTKLVPTLDNRFGDFDKPNSPGSPPVSTWYFGHRKESPGIDGITAGWQCENGDNGWTGVQATFGVYGQWTGPAAEHELPAPHSDMSAPASREVKWKAAEYSLTRGIAHDRIHVRTLGPKAHVPSEFLAFGTVEAGEAVQVRTAAWSDEEQTLLLAVGAGADKRIWVNGQEAESTDRGYLAYFPVRLREGLNALEFRLTARTKQELRAYWSFVRSRDNFARPEWLQVPAPYVKDDRVTFTGKVHLPFPPVRGTIQMAADGTASIRVNGTTVGRQGGFDPYAKGRRVLPYPVSCFRQGENTIEVVMEDIGKAAGILIDGIAEAEDGRTVTFPSGTDWTVCREAHSPQQADLWLDWKINDLSIQEPAYHELWRRPHPLPGAEWIEDRTADGTVVTLDVDAGLASGSVEWLRWTLPPGATHAIIPADGEARLWVDGKEIPIVEESTKLPNPEGVRRTAVLRIIPNRGKTGGGILRGPVTYRVGTGRMEPGDWTAQGLETYSGGVHYESAVNLDRTPKGRVILDLGEVRGTAEVRVNERQAGICIWSPYRLDVTELLTVGNNRIEITVFNTIANYLHGASPTHYIVEGQLRSGLFGPVRLLSETRIGRSTILK
ncbi:hypothetical protein FHS19_002878 [Paenibacillus rhizosphaerae]|uniref:Glycosyl hydrolases family 2 sugar binding domain-containing protein n=1 Tax=Paenibacillus rhizosphaerae TaxID=297318 RepID=A0A839TMW4_9BACL|nr:glycosylhydrolase-like jelly roll fold domain-containing protein [Paenibacillus rhizosphaerae]MBB3128224.1 hypothetical protein [Paenibacillus rhizosphaerae]